MPAQLPQLAEFAGTHPGLSIVIDHLATLRGDDPAGMEAWRMGIAEVAWCGNVSMKLSGLWSVDRGWRAERLAPHLRHVLAHFGAARCM